MAATVPELRNIIAQQDASGYDLTAITRAVRSTTWLDAVRLQCWLAGRGSMDVPAHNPMVTISAGTTSAFRYWTKPRYQTTRYAYTFVITGTAAACTVAIPSGGTAHSVPISSPRTMAPITLYADRSARSAAEAELSFDITAPAGSDVTVQCVSIEALPRATLDVDANDLGAERFDFWVRQPIASANIYDQIL
ncbi:MAG TPA: hypothetical protein VFS15_28940, partial [Kofleriaceae bacterium]|nr:hypothetical protein [Kofleriaceae bacterium]